MSRASADRPGILVAGIGGASLGTEIMKCLQAARRYRILGCDISRYAYGHYAGLADQTEVISADNYVQNVIEFAQRTQCRAVVAGAGAPLKLLNQGFSDLRDNGITIIGNNPETVGLADDKRAVAERLDKAGVPQPRWVSPESASASSIGVLGGPLIVKPASDSGASRFVFLAEDSSAARVYVDYLVRNGLKPIVQEYVSEENGEYSIGAVSRSDGSWVGAIVMQRIFVNELSVRTRTNNGLISSPYGQGVFGEFPTIVAAARKISLALNSTGPLNIQGRVRDGEFIPFEVNARFSGSCFLRALAGFNEVDLVIGEQMLGENISMPAVRSGWVFRDLSETFVSPENLK